jgi:hypothetical protein
MEMKTKSKAGGGANSRQVKQVGLKTGPNSTNKMNVKGVAQQGTKLGNREAVERIKDGTMKQVPLGNTLAPKVTQGPGGSRTVSKAGSQAQTGSGGPARPEGRDLFADFPPTK